MGNVEMTERDLPVLFSAFVLGLIAFIIGYNVAGSRNHEPMPTPAEMRAELSSRCVAVPDVLAEIQDKLPDNIDGLITPAIVRKVLRDVVSHC